MLSIPQKRCRTCGADKPLSDFYKHRRSPDQHASECKDCVKARALAWARSNAERNRERARAWYANNTARAKTTSKASRERLREQRGDVLAPTVPEKRCRKCNRVLPASAFGRHRGMTDGLQRYCKACSLATHGAWRETNPHRLRRYRQATWLRYRDKILARGRDRHQRNREEINARKRAYKARPEVAARIKERTREYQARKKTATVEVVSFDAVWIRDHGVCYLCSLPVERADCHFDHVIPLSRGGAHSMDNVKVTHSACNLKKGSKLLGELS